MPDYKNKLDEWQRAAKQKAREIDEKIGISSRVEEGARVAQEAARRGAERAWSEAEKLSADFEVPEGARRAADEASRFARKAAETARDAAGSAGETAEGVFGSAKGYYDRASSAYDVGASITRASTAATVGLFKARDWVKAHPGQAALVTISFITGVRLGSAFPSLDAILLGSHPHWFTHSVIPVFGLRKIGEKFDDYLRKQERLVASGELDAAQAKRVEFERDIVKLVGAPLLGAFSCAAGAAMWAQILQPGRITGAPISWLLGGNPFLEGVWLFSNGLLCFHEGYRFFMIAFADQDEVARVVKEIKGLLPEAGVA